MNQPELDRINVGTQLTVGTHSVKILKYLTSGGFAQIYAVEILSMGLFNGSNVACLKRVKVPDKLSLNILRAEVDAMKLLANNKHVVSYIDSHATRSPTNDGTYEVFLLMEYCEGGGLIDFMNTRLQNRLTEPEILDIMSQTTQGIAVMHALVPPLLHRDIKIENVLLSKGGIYKVCDFGSVSGVIRPPRNQQELLYVQHDIMKNTTAQYRCPEMLDLYRGLPIDEKADIWALGVFLYKLCYYTTPFEKLGEPAILHARFQFPSFPNYSDRLKNLIKSMLREHPSDRPNVCQVLEEVSRMQNVPCPIRNFYLLRAMEKVKLSTEIDYPQLQLQKLRNAQADNLSNPMIKPMPIAQRPTFSGNGMVNNNRTLPTVMVSNNVIGNGSQVWDNSKPPEPQPIPQSRSFVKSSTLIGAPLSKSWGHNEFNFGSISNSPSVFQGAIVPAANQLQNKDSSHQPKPSGMMKKNEQLQVTSTFASSPNTRTRTNSQGSSLYMPTSSEYRTRHVHTGDNNSLKSSKLDSNKLDIAVQRSPSSRSDGSDFRLPLNPNSEKRKSIQLRVQHLLDNMSSNEVKKSAQGYGKYTDELSSTGTNIPKVTPDSPVLADLIDFNDVPAIRIPSDKNQLSKSGKIKPAPPPKPKKLRSNKKISTLSALRLEPKQNDRITSDATDVLMHLNVDDLEEDFKRRFPSAV